MSKHIIDAIRRLPELRGSLFHTAKEIAHRANGRNGIAYVTYQYIADKAHISRRTAIRHVNKLVAMGIFRCTRFWGPDRHWSPNRYQFAIAWEKPSAAPPHSHYDDTMSRNLPIRQEEEKWGTLQAVENIPRRVGDWLTPGSLAWQAAQEGCGMH